MAKRVLNVQDVTVRVYEYQAGEYISLNDMVKASKDGKSIIGNWLRNKNTLEFLGIWEKINNPDFNLEVFEKLMRESGTNRFTISIKEWIGETNAIGLEGKTGRYGGTFAHKDIAMEFGAWVSPEFKLYLIREFDRLKQEEFNRLKNSWDLKRELSKINYRIHTDAVKESLVPPEIQKSGLEGILYANEADILNKALFGMTAAEWREQNPNTDGNIRDHATHMQLILLINLQSINAEFIRLGIPTKERLYRLNQVVRDQIKSLVAKQGKVDKLGETRSNELNK